jgi:hypothetical protein
MHHPKISKNAHFDHLMQPQLHLYPQNVLESFEYCILHTF